MTQQYRRKSHTVSLVNYHLVWIPKRRKKVLMGDVEKRLRQIIWDVALEKEWNIIALEIMPDHVHLFINVPPNIAPHDVAKAIKGRSSRLLRQEFPHLLKLPSLWTHSYFVSTAGNVSSETIRIYIEEQRHHDTT
ncbi:transposase IS200-family protein [Gloeothece citriformis PCC 7424]|uniref:Transposase IS200-family protein n=1 Tax=Gloeothece citriformis (strain PCC 7424) TaxID=65393 RepID=B7KG42_GLOC7|nr:IS200/IS605 family transposase [Gloeothece citriformis]ACK69235.1 transposase IS200-family protein [Gloeothece citriformis PCC 7424]